MRIIKPSTQQRRVIVQAMHAVVSAEGRIAIEPIEHDSLAAIQRHLMNGEVLPPDVGQTLPADLATVVVDRQMRLTLIRILTMLPFVDGKVLAEKADVVERAAAALGINDSGIGMLRQAVKRQYRRITAGILHRAVKQFWASDGRPHMHDWADMVFVMLPMLSFSRKRLRDRYQALESRRPDSFGHVLFNFYRSNGFSMPGERKSFPEKFVLHECYHIIGSYPLTHQGEMLVAAFTGGNVERLCMEMILLSLLQYHVGARVAGVARGVPGMLRPSEFFEAIGRGAAMRVNLMEGWDFWAAADRTLDELRTDYALPPLFSAESFEPLVVHAAPQS